MSNWKTTLFGNLYTVGFAGLTYLFTTSQPNQFVGAKVGLGILSVVSKSLESCFAADKKKEEPIS